MSFGGETIDNFGVVRDFPAASMLTGLIANALGWRRTDTDKLDRLQDRLVFAVRLDRPGTRFTEYQTARLLAEDQGWTTRGRPEGRNKESSSFKVDVGQYRKTGEKVRSQTHERYRDYDADALVTVVLRLDPAAADPDLDAVADALDAPARPLFIGRKACLPASRLVAGRIAGATVEDALRSLPLLADHPSAGKSPRAFWPRAEGAPVSSTHAREFTVTDRRNWRSGVHGGSRLIVEGEVVPPPADKCGQP